MAVMKDYNRRQYTDTDPSNYALERDIEYERLAQFFDGGYGALPCFSNMPRWTGGGNIAIAAPNAGVIQGSYVWLPKGAVINRVAVYTRGTAGATLTHRWVAIWAAAETSLIRQSTDNTAATMATNTLFEHSLTSAWTVPASAFYPIGIMIAGTTLPSLAGISLGIQDIAAPSLTGLTLPFSAWTSGSALVATAPASVATKAKAVNMFQFFVY